MPHALPPPRLAQQDPASVDALYRAHHGWLEGWLRGKLGPSQDHAADLAHDTFVRVLHKQLLAPLHSPRPFLVTIARGLMIDLFRRQDLERAYLEVLASQPEPQAPSPEQQALVIETLLQVDAMLDGLGSRPKQAFLLAQLDGMSYPDIARTLGVSVSSVKNYMVKALTHCLTYQLAQD